MSRLRELLKRFLPMPAASSKRWFAEQQKLLLALRDDALSQAARLEALIEAQSLQGYNTLREEGRLCEERLSRQLNAVEHNILILVDRELDESKRGLAEVKEQLEKIGEDVNADATAIVVLENTEKILSHLHRAQISLEKTTENNKKLGLSNINVERQLWELAAMESAKYVLEHMHQTRAFPLMDEMLVHFVKASLPDGLFLEFGVFSGQTIRLIADSRPETTIYGFDSMKGLPEDWRTGFPKSTFARNALPEVRSNVLFVLGWFDEVLPEFLEQHNEMCSFIHMDCDLYSSTRTVLRALVKRLQVGTYIVFDEYYNYPGWQRHEFKAFQEFVQEYGIEYEYMGYVPSFEQVAVRISKI